MLKSITYKIITVPFINKVLLYILSFLKPILPVAKLIHFPVMGTLDLRFDKIQFKMYTDGRDKIASNIYWGQGVTGFESSTIAVFQQMLPHINTMFDIGANTGVFSLIALGKNKQTKVYAFEPMPEVFEYLQRNFKLNQFTSAHAYQKAVGDKQDSLTLHVPQHLTLATGSSVIKWEAEWPEISVEVIRLDDFVQENHIDKVDFIKIDVEKFEPQVIEGAQETIKRDRPILICEILDDYVGVQIDKYFAQWDYCYYHIGTDAVTQQTSLKSNIEHSISHTERNYLLMPSEKTHWLQLD